MDDLDLTDEMSDADYLRDLSDRIFRIPVMHGVDQGDCSRLQEIARRLTAAGDAVESEDLSVILLAREIVRGEKTKFGWSDVGDVLVSLMRKETTPADAMYRLALLKTDYDRERGA